MIQQIIRKNLNLQAALPKPEPENQDIEKLRKDAGRSKS